MCLALYGKRHATAFAIILNFDVGMGLRCSPGVQLYWHRLRKSDSLQLLQQVPRTHPQGHSHRGGGRRHHMPSLRILRFLGHGKFGS